jgi:hypothetical protein
MAEAGNTNQPGGRDLGDSGDWSHIQRELAAADPAVEQEATAILRTLRAKVKLRKACEELGILPSVVSGAA